MASDANVREAKAPPSRRPAALAVLSLIAAALVACGDPSKDLAIEALGPESPGVAEGPLHRPGQPCLVCHDGTEARAFSMAGTVYWTPDSDEPAAGASVHLVDALERRFEAITNCNGNFFIMPEEFEPKYPSWVSIGVGSMRIVMDSPINGDGSCARCHGMSPGPESAGRVYVSPIAPEVSAQGCP